jgi:hypothetical protein
VCFYNGSSVSGTPPGSHHAMAGSYSAQMSVEGTRMSPATVDFTVNTKNGLLAAFGLALALLLALLFIMYKEETRDDLQPEEKWDIRFGASECIFPLGVTGWAMYSLYAGSAAWGADSISSVVAFLTTAFTAVGVRSLLTIGRGKTSAARPKKKPTH